VKTPVTPGDTMHDTLAGVTGILSHYVAPDDDLPV